MAEGAEPRKRRRPGRRSTYRFKKIQKYRRFVLQQGMLLGAAEVLLIFWLQALSPLILIPIAIYLVVVVWSIRLARFAPNDSYDTTGDEYITYGSMGISALAILLQGLGGFQVILGTHLFMFLMNLNATRKLPPVKWRKRTTTISIGPLLFLPLAFFIDPLSTQGLVIIAMGPAFLSGLLLHASMGRVLERTKRPPRMPPKPHKREQDAPAEEEHDEAEDGKKPDLHPKVEAAQVGLYRSPTMELDPEEE